MIKHDKPWISWDKSCENVRPRSYSGEKRISHKDKVGYLSLIQKCTLQGSNPGPCRSWAAALTTEPRQLMLMTDTVFCCNILQMLEQWRQQWEPVPLLYPIDILHILLYPSSISYFIPVLYPSSISYFIPGPARRRRLGGP